MTLCCNTICGAIGIALTVSGNNVYKNGDPEGAESKFKGAKIALIVGVVLSIVISIVYVAIFLNE